MRVCRSIFLIALAFVVETTFAAATTPSEKPAAVPYRSGFFMPDTVQQITVSYKTLRGLIVLPMVLNDSIRVNLILDTGCRTLVLFGNRFSKFLKTEANKTAQFSGYGDGKPVFGKISLYNKISMQQMLGENIPLVIVPNRNFLQNFSNVHGIIGYDILTKFEIEINPAKQTITFRSAPNSTPPSDYEYMDLNVIDCRPVLTSTVYSGRKKSTKCDLMIDTGSALSLLFRVKGLDDNEYSRTRTEELIGLNGTTLSYNTFTNKIQLNNIEMKGVKTGVVHAAHKNGASIGMGLLKNYVIIFNYCKSYVCLKKISS
jgi:hypothetical protein